MTTETLILYSTGCPRCNVLIKKLDNKNLKYSVVSSVEEMQELGISEVPVLKVGDNFLNFGQANKWINETKEDNNCTSTSN